MKAGERNARIITLMESYIQKAKDGDFTIEDSFSSDLNGIFDTTVFGFREVVITALMGKMIDEDFKPTDSFYLVNREGSMKLQFGIRYCSTAFPIENPGR